MIVVTLDVDTNTATTYQYWNKKERVWSSQFDFYFNTKLCVVSKLGVVNVTKTVKKQFVCHCGSTAILIMFFIVLPRNVTAVILLAVAITITAHQHWIKKERVLISNLFLRCYLRFILKSGYI